MNAEECKRFNEANKVVHPVETQWHYPILTKYGFNPVTKEGIGFVRGYEYKHSDGRIISANSDGNADYWNSKGFPKDATGFWADLEPFLKDGIIPECYGQRERN